MVLLPDLVEDNPWWKSPDEISNDDKITEWEASSIKWDPRIRHKFDYSNDIVYSLRGPRQVGKTTLIKLQIRDFLNSGISPWNIMYYAFDIDNTPKHLVDIIKNYLDNTKLQRKNKRCYLFLDEISSIKDWQKGIKRLWDQKRLQNCTVIATGSHSIDLKISSERLPGRRGETEDTYDKILPPMKFSEYVSSIDPSLKDKMMTLGLLKAESRSHLFKKLIEFNIDKSLYELQAHLSELNRYLTTYLLTGGIPKVVNEYLKRNHIRENIYTVYLDTILGDLKSLNRDETLFKQLIANVIKNISWPCSWRSLCKDTDIGSFHTAMEYIHLLRDMFVLTIFYQYDAQKKQARLDKDKKINFHDVFFLHALNGWLSSQDFFNVSHDYVTDQTREGLLVEGVVGDHLIRLAFSLSVKKQTFDYSNHVFHWRYGKNEEVDYVLNDGADLELPIEVKFQNTITNRDLDGIINFKKSTDAKSGIIVSKDIMDVNSECVIIPAPIFLLLI